MNDDEIETMIWEYLKEAKQILLQRPREYTVSGLACELLEKENIAGTHHFKYKGELLKDIDSRINPQ